MANIRKSIDSSSLAEVIDRILDKGIVIDAWAKALAPIELISVEARVVIASVETWLKYADAVGLMQTFVTSAARHRSERAVSDAEQFSHEEFASQERRLLDRVDALSAPRPSVEVDK